MTSRVNSAKKSIDDVLKQLEGAPLANERKNEPKAHGAGMAKLHTLLTSRTSTPPTTLKGAASTALLSTRHYRRATEVFNLHQNVFPFLELPAELRFLVYKELLMTDDRLILTWRGPRKSNKQQKAMYPAIMRTSKLCADEGASVLYGENLFDFEEITGRPSVAKQLLKCIGTRNPTRMRIIVCEYSAAQAENSITEYDLEEFPLLMVSEIDRFFRAYNIDLAQLRMFAISIIPYGLDDMTTKIMRIQTSDLPWQDMSPAREKWLRMKNEGVVELLNSICEREKELRKVDFMEGVYSKIGFHWWPPSAGRHWIAYQKT